MTSPPPAQTLADDADPTYSHFVHREECLALLALFLNADVAQEPSAGEDEAEVELVRRLGAIFDYYLPLPGLLDPSLEDIVPPLMQTLAGVVSRLEDGLVLASSRLERLGSVINWVIKVRGWKAVAQHFPSSIHFLPQLVALLSPPLTASSKSSRDTPHQPLLSPSSAWEVRAVLLLWLALLLTAPFSLAAFSSEPCRPSSYGVDVPAAARLFSSSSTPLAPLAQRAILLSLSLLHRPGKEGSSAALVLARIYSRPDAVDHLPGLFAWAAGELSEGERENEANIVASLLTLLSLLPGMLPPGHLAVLEAFINDTLLSHLRGSRTAASSALVRKLVIKARGRWWMARLQAHAEQALQDEGLEEELDSLMGGLADKDTIVRYSSAKYLARVSAALPSEYAAQIVMAVVQLFAGTEDEPVIESRAGTVIDPGENPSGSTVFGGAETVRGEARWHGVCLAIAEMARRGLVRDEAIGEAVRWVLKALTFDIRRATHSVGSNVRDAAAYVLWSLSRASPPSALAPHATQIATGLISVACLDREVGVRRAASAAFQEGVGRLSLYPEGIDVLAKTDFYSVSVRRIAFTVAAPAVAVHAEYRRALRAHLHGITLRHWDETMRTAGAILLRELLSVDASDTADAVEQELSQLRSLDSHNVHGALAALAEIVPSLPTDDARRGTIFTSLRAVRPAALISPQAACLLISACDLICGALTPAILALSDADAASEEHKVLEQFIETTMRRREEACHEAVARVYARMSGMRGSARDVVKLVGDFKSMRAAQKQAAALCLGSVRYARCPEAVDRAVEALLGLLAEGTKADVETRRYAIRSLASIAVQKDSDGVLLVSPILYCRIASALLAALSDYSTDQRGDVGSWIRAASLRALQRVITPLIHLEPSARDERMPQHTFDDVLRGLARLAVEKLEPVRCAAGAAWGGLRRAGAARGGVWEWEGEEAFGLADGLPDDGAEEAFRQIDQKEWFASAMPLLQTRYRADLIGGLVLTIGSQVESIALTAFQPLETYLSTSSTTDQGDLVLDVLRDVGDVMAAELGSNRVFVPALQAVGRIAASHRIRGTGKDLVALDESWTRIVKLASRGVGQIKSIERLSAALHLVVAVLCAPVLGDTTALDVRPNTRARAAALAALPLFLSHRFPRIRAMAAERVYLALSEADGVDELGDELEEILLGTVWTELEVDKQAGSADGGPGLVKDVVRLIGAVLELGEGGGEGGAL